MPDLSSIDLGDPYPWARATYRFHRPALTHALRTAFKSWADDRKQDRTVLLFAGAPRTPVEAALLGELPTGAVAVRHLPQVALLRETDVFVNHGGNGSVTEAVAARVPMVVLPFSTDQFAGAAALERAGVGVVLAPNSITPESLVAAVTQAAERETKQRLLRVSEAGEVDGGAARAARMIAARG